MYQIRKRIPVLFGGIDISPIIAVRPEPLRITRFVADNHLGKLARYGHLDGNRKRELEVIALNLLGEDDEFRWDRAFVVRREASEALEYFRD